MHTYIIMQSFAYVVLVPSLSCSYGNWIYNYICNQCVSPMLILGCSQGCYAVKIWPGDLDLWPMTLKINTVPDSLKD